MSVSSTFSNINSLGDISFVAGNTYTLKFVMTDQSGSTIDLSTATIRWRMAPYGTDYVQLNKSGSVTAAGIFTVLLTSADTAGLNGKFSHQPEIELASGVVLHPGQGIITLVQGLI